MGGLVSVSLQELGQAISTKQLASFARVEYGIRELGSQPRPQILTAIMLAECLQNPQDYKPLYGYSPAVAEQLAKSQEGQQYA